MANGFGEPNIENTVSHRFHQLIYQLVDVRETRRQPLFASQQKPSISMVEFIERFQKYLPHEPPLAFVLWLLNKMSNDFSTRFSEYNIHRYVLVAICVAGKYLYDNQVPGQLFARIAGIQPRELATLELEFLKQCHWDLYCSPEEHQLYQKQLDPKGSEIPLCGIN